MRVVILSIEFPPGPGGLGALACQAARHLSERGWQVVVMTPQDHVDEPEIERFSAVQPFEIRRVLHVDPPIWEGVQRLLIALQEVRRRRPVVVLAVGMQAVWLGAMLVRLTRLPLVAVGIGSEFGASSRIAKVLNRWAFGCAQTVIAISQRTRQLMIDAGVRSTGTVVVPCGADASLYRSGLGTDALRARLGIGASRVLLTVGQLSERKAQDVVIRALPHIVKTCPDVAYVLVGLPTRREELGRLAQDLGVGDHVVFAGMVPTSDLPGYYNLADVFVLVSRRTAKGEVEGYGIVVAEAALCGVPSVVSTECGIAESMSGSKAALVIEPDDPLATANAILRLLSDDTLRAEMGCSARRYILETSTWAQRMSRYHQILVDATRGS